MKTNGNAPIGVIDGYYGADAMSSGNTGLTKREHFAAITQIDVSDMELEFAQALAGYKIPERKINNGESTTESLLAIAKFWSDVAARYKVLKADALIAALNKEVTNG